MNNSNSKKLCLQLYFHKLQNYNSACLRLNRILTRKYSQNVYGSRSSRNPVSLENLFNIRPVQGWICLSPHELPTTHHWGWCQRRALVL